MRVIVSVQVLDDVPHVGEVAGGGGEDSLHADHAPIRTALTLTHPGQYVRRGSLHVTPCTLHHMTPCTHLNTARHGGRLVHVVAGLGGVHVLPGNLDQEDGDNDHEEEEDGDDADGDSDEVLHLHLHHQGVSTGLGHLERVVGHGLARLVLRQTQK